MRACHICYHIDEDGLAAASVIYEYLKIVNKSDKKNVKYFFYKVDYTVNLKEILTNIPAGDEIYFVDYSFSDINNLYYAFELSNKDIKVTWIDHHKTSSKIIYDLEYKGISLDQYPNFYCFIDTQYCGAYLAYVYAYCTLNDDYIVNNQRYSFIYPEYIPLYIKYVDSWDTWKHNMDETTEFNIGAKSVRRTPKNALSIMLGYNANVINKLFSDQTEDNEIVDSYMKKYIKKVFISRGRIIKQYQDIQNESICNDCGFRFSIIDDADNKRVYNCFAVNKLGNSTMFGDRVDKYDIVVPFQFNGEMWKYSLYTTKVDVDCEKLARKLGSIDGLGGGGHEKAAGFQTYDQLIEAGCTVRIRNRLFKKDKVKVSSNATAYIE